MRLGQTSVIYVFSKFGISIIGFLATIYFTRTLGAEIYGYYAITIALVGWLGIVKSIGFGKAIIKRMSENQEPDAYLAAGTLIKAALTTVVILLVLFFQTPINNYVGQPVAEFVIIILIASIFSGLVNSALKGRHKVHIYAPLSTLKEASRSVLMVILVYIGWELSGMLLGHALGTFLMAMIGLAIVRPNLAIPKKRHITGLFDFAKYSWLGSMRNKSFSDADILILGLFVPAGLTGIYAVAYSLSKFLEIIGKAIQNTLFPEMSKLATEDNFELVSKLTNDAITFAGLFLIPGFVGAAILGDRLLLVYGDDFNVGHGILVILILALVIYSYTRQLLNTLNAIDRPDLAFRANGVFIGANIILNLSLVYQFGWYGAAVATFISACIGLVLSLYYLRQLIEFSLPVTEIVRQLLAAGIMGLFVLIGRYVGEDTILSEYNVAFMITLVGVGAAIYLTSLFVLSVQFRTVIRNNVPADLIPF